MVAPAGLARAAGAADELRACLGVQDRELPAGVAGAGAATDLVTLSAENAMAAGNAAARRLYAAAGGEEESEETVIVWFDLREL